MGLLDKLGISKVDDGQAPERQPKQAKQPRAAKQPRQPKQQGGRRLGGLLEKSGIQAEALPSDEERIIRERHNTIIMAWQYLRAMIDKGIKEYYASGEDHLLVEHVERPALDALKDHLNQLRMQGIYWEQPKRRQSTQPDVKVIDEQLDAENIPVEFTVQERFYDFSLLQKIEFDENGPRGVVDEARADGQQLVMNARVKVVGDQLFRLVSVERVEHAL